MSDKFGGLPERILGIEEVLEMGEHSDIEEAAPVSAYTEFGLATSFFLKRSSQVHIFGFDDEAGYWVMIGRFDESEEREAIVAANDWIEETYSDKDEMHEFGIDDPPPEESGGLEPD